MMYGGRHIQLFRLHFSLSKNAKILALRPRAQSELSTYCASSNLEMLLMTRHDMVQNIGAILAVA